MNTFFCLLICIFSIEMCAEEKPIVVIVPSYNNILWYQKNLDSLVAQTYSHFRIIYIDDCSTDGTGKAVEQYIHQNNMHNKIRLMHNAVRRGAMYNHYQGAHLCSDDTIVVTVDGDDWFPDGDTTVLDRVNAAYQDLNVWMTYGQFQEHPTGGKGLCRQIPGGVQRLHAYRHCGWMTSHLRTYYAGLFKQVPVGYFIRKGVFLEACCDLAIMFSLLELAEGRALFIPDIMYIYNAINSNSDSRTQLLGQYIFDHWIRTCEPLSPLKVHPCTISLRNGESHLCNIHISTQGSDACERYITSTPHAHLTPEQIFIWYSTESNDKIAQYQAMCVRYQVMNATVESVGFGKENILTFLASLPINSYIVLTTDGCVWQDNWDSADTIKALNKTKAISFACARGCDTPEDAVLSAADTRPAFVSVGDNYYVWKYSDSQGTWHNPYYPHGILIRADELKRVIEGVKGSSLNQLLTNLSQLPAQQRDDVGVCLLKAPCTKVCYSEIE